MSEELNKIIAKDPDQKEFHQAVQEVIETVQPVLDRNPEYRHAKIIERLAEPERGRHVPGALDGRHRNRSG